MDRSSEELLEFLYVTPTGIAYTDGDGAVLSVNPTLTSMLLVLGISPTAPMNVVGFLGSLDPAFVEMLRQGDLSDYILATGREGIVYLKIQARRLGSGNLAFVVEDFTERMVLERELAKSNAAKDRLFSIIAHDLRGPMGGLASSLELLTTSPEVFDEDEMHKLLLRMKESSQSTYSLLENLLAWARSSQGTLVPNPCEIHISELIRGILPLFDFILREKKIRMHIECGDAQTAFADEEMTRTVVRNLVSNACKFTPEGGTVTVTCAADDENVSISVSDSGVGIEPDRIPTLFEIDRNKSTVGTHGERGNGLGLILCKEFARKTEGDIEVESTLGEGSTFRLLLPAVPPQA